MTLALVAVALGVMVGTALVQPFGKSLGQLPKRTEQTLGKVIGQAIIAESNIQQAVQHERERVNKHAAERARQVDDDPEATDSSGGSV